MRRLLSFRKLGMIIYALLGLIPYMLAAYLVVYFRTELPTTVLIIAVAALMSHLFGLTVIDRVGRQLKVVDDECAEVTASIEKKTIPLDKEMPEELAELVVHFNELVGEVTSADRNYREMTTKLMVYAQDVESYQKKLMGEALMRQQLSRYVSSGLVDELLHSDGDVRLQDRRAKVTVLFADIRSFTSIVENMAPELVVGMLNDYFEAMTAVVFAYNGALDKFVGDELMAVFGLADSEDHGASAAVDAAMAMQQTVSMLMERFRQKKEPTFAVGIGINTGDVLVGNVGSRNRMDYTVIGDVVNVAARLQQQAEGGSVVIGEETYRYNTSQVHIIRQGEVAVRHREKPVKFYQVTGDNSGTTEKGA